MLRKLQQRSTLSCTDRTRKEEGNKRERQRWANKGDSRAPRDQRRSCWSRTFCSGFRTVCVFERQGSVYALLFCCQCSAWSCHTVLWLGGTHNLNMSFWVDASCEHDQSPALLCYERRFRGRGNVTKHGAIQWREEMCVTCSRAVIVICAWHHHGALYTLQEGDTRGVQPAPQNLLCARQDASRANNVLEETEK